MAWGSQLTPAQYTGTVFAAIVIVVFYMARVKPSFQAGGMANSTWPRHWGEAHSSKSLYRLGIPCSRRSHTLAVDTGPYRMVRHPIYLGLIFAAFATAIEKGTSFALFGAAVLTFAFYTNARPEERFLRVELGEGAYDAYARKTAMLVPFKGRQPN